MPDPIFDKAIAGRMTKFRIDELSGVDRPAQGPARAVLMKRDGGGAATPYWKKDYSADQRKEMADAGQAMPDGSFPIKTGADLKNAIRAIGRASDPAAAKAHIISRAKALGATDTLPEGWVSKSGKDREGEVMNSAIKKALGLPETASDDETAAAITKAAADLKQATADLAKAKAVADMADDEKDYCKEMSDTEKESFMSMTPADRKAKMKKAMADDEVLTVGGATIRKSAVGEGVFAVMKAQQERLDGQAEEIKKAREESETAAFAKRATDEFPHVAGTVDERVAMLRHVAKADEGVRKAFDAVFTAAERLAKSAFARVGHDGGIEPAETSAEAQLNKKAEEIRKAKPELSFAKAYAEACRANPDLYAKADGRAAADE